MKLRLDIGRQEFGSVGSNDGFLSRGRVTAIFCLTGRVHCSNDALHMRAITGDMTSSTLFSSHVGAGSRMQCFAGAFPNDRFTSSEVTGLNAARGSGTERVLMTGGGAPAVDTRMFSTFRAKWSAKSSAE